MNIIVQNLKKKVGRTPGTSPVIPDDTIISLIQNSKYNYLLDDVKYERFYVPKNVPQGTDGRFGHTYNGNIFLTEIYAFKNKETEKFECVIISIQFDNNGKVKIPTCVDIQCENGKASEIANKVFSGWKMLNGQDITYDGYLYEDAYNEVN